MKIAIAAALVLLFVCCGAAVAADLTATLSTNSIVEKVTIHDVDTSQSYKLNLTASSLLWDKYKLQVLEESDLYIKPFELEVTCNSTPLTNVNLTIQFKVNKTKIEEYDALGNYQVRLGHLKADKKWELLEVEPVTLPLNDGNLHYNVTAQEPTPLFVIVVTKKPVTKEVDSNGTATFGEDGKMTIIPSAASIVSEVKLMDVSGLTEGDNLSFYNLSGNNPLLIATLKNSCPAGYSSQEVISLFALKTDGDNTGTQVIHMDAMVNESAGYNPDNLKVIHFKDGAWENHYLPSTHSGNTYEVTTNGFSPFAFVYAEPAPAPTPEPTPQKSSSRSSGASVWLQATPTPTPTPAPVSDPIQTEEATPAQPAVSPVNQPPQQTATPAPAAGIIAGLGAACVLFGVRRK